MDGNQSLQIGQFDLYRENLLGESRWGGPHVFAFSFGSGARVGRIPLRSNFKTPLPIWLSEC